MPPLSPDEWFEMVLEPYPTATATTYRWAPRPFADAGSWKEGRLVSRGPIERALSDDDGHYQVSTLRVTLDDQDGLIRGLLAANTTQWFTGREASYYLLSEAGRRASTTPRTLFRGRVSDVQLLPNRQIAIDVQDLVGSAFSNFNLDKTIGIPLGSEHTALPEDSIGKIYPIIYGEHSDRGAVDENGDSAEKGLLPVIDTGDYHPFGEDVPTTYVTPPRNCTATLIGAGSGSRTYYYAITAVTNFGETTISNIASVSGCPDSLDSATYVEVTWDPPATGSAYVIAYKVYGRSTNPPSKRLDTMNNGGTFVSPEVIYRDGRQGSRTDFDTEKSPGPPKTNTAVLEGTNMAWGRLLVGLGAVTVHQVYGSDLADGTAPKRVALDIDGTDLVTANSVSWPHPDPYIELGGIRQTVIYLRGPRLQAHRDGQVTIAVNACGYEDVGDGSGTLIDQAFYQGQHFINEHILKDDGTGYRTGAWGPLEAYSNGDEQIKTSAFTAAQDLSIARIGGLGYLGAWTIHEPTTVREWVRRFNVTFDCFLGANHHGQILVALIDERATPTAGRHYRDRIDMVSLSDQRFDHDAIETAISYDYDYDTDSQAFRIVDRYLEDTDATAALKGLRQGAKQELFYTRDGATAYDTRLRRLFRHKRAPRYVSVTTNYLGVEEELSDQIRLTHYDGLGATGDVNTPGFIRKHRIDRGTTTLEMLDLRRMGTLIVTGATEAGGHDQHIALVVPTATAHGAAVTRAAGTNHVALTSPAVTVGTGFMRAAGTNAIAFRVPTATATGGAVARAAGAVTLTLVPPAIANVVPGDEDMLIVKAADETVNNSTALQDDDHLTFSAAANTTYLVDLYLLLNGGITADYKFAWSLPAGATWYWAAEAEGGGGGISVYWVPKDVGSGSMAALSSGTLSVNGSANTPQGLHLTSIIVIAGTAGSATLQWAQNTLTAADTKVLANSVMRVTTET